MNIKGGIPHKELSDTIDGVRKGKKKAIKKFSEYAEKGLIRTELYTKIMTECRINETKKDRERSNNIKSVLAVGILFVSMLCGLAYLIEHYGKGSAVWYIFLWVWAISYAFSN